MENRQSKTGWVACDYTQGDSLVDVRHGKLHDLYADAVRDVARDQYDGVRYVHSDGYLYVEPPNSEDVERDA